MSHCCPVSWHSAAYLILCSKADSQNQPEAKPNPSHDAAASAFVCCHPSSPLACSLCHSSATTGGLHPQDCGCHCHPLLLFPNRAPHFPLLCVSGELGTKSSSSQGLEAGDLPQQPSHQPGSGVQKQPPLALLPTAFSSTRSEPLKVNPSLCFKHCPNQSHLHPVWGRWEPRVGRGNAPSEQDRAVPSPHRLHRPSQPCLQPHLQREGNAPRVPRDPPRATFKASGCFQEALKAREVLLPRRNQPGCPARHSSPAGSTEGKSPFGLKVNQP